MSVDGLVVVDYGAGNLRSVEKALVSLGGKLEALYYAFGGSDVYLLFDCPDNVSAAAFSLAASSSGLVRTKTIPLLTVEETDQALARQTAYRAPGA